MNSDKLNSLDWISIIIIFIGGLNWGLVGLFNFDIVSFVFGQSTLLARLAFAFVGASTLYAIVSTIPKIAEMENCVDHSMSDKVTGNV